MYDPIFLFCKFQNLQFQTFVRFSIVFNFYFLAFPIKVLVIINVLHLLTRTSKLKINSTVAGSLNNCLTD